VDQTIRTHVDNLFTSDRDLQNQAYAAVIEATNTPVDWAYDVWAMMLANLTDKDNHNRAIAAQVLCNLAKSDPDSRMLKDFDTLLAVTKDTRFVTARHCLQNIWKVGTAGTRLQQTLLAGLERRFNECGSEKNCTLIRYDIIQGLRNLYDVVKDEAIKMQAMALIATEPDIKYRKKYATMWKVKSPAMLRNI
jgi:hypothetical protein